MSEYTEDCILLDTTRRRMVENVREALKSAWLLDRRIRKTYGHAISAWAQAALVEQREKIQNFIPHLEDLLDYMEEERAWAPSESQFDFAATLNAADAMLKK